MAAEAEAGVHNTQATLYIDVRRMQTGGNNQESGSAIRQTTQERGASERKLEDSYLSFKINK